MELLTKTIKTRLPPIGSREGKGGKAVAALKFFTPDSSWTWFATEGSALVRHADDSVTEEPADYAGEGRVIDYIFFGLVEGMEKELGYFYLSELRQARGPLDLPIERDLYWEPRPLEQIAPELFETREAARTPAESQSVPR